MIWLVGAAVLLLAIALYVLVEIYNTVFNIKELLVAVLRESQSRRVEARGLMQDMERHAARMAKPFYEADRENERKRREDPASYYWDRDNP